MKGILSQIEIVEVLHQAGRDCEVCATAEAHYDDASSKVSVTLKSFLRPVDLRGKEAHESAAWLPPTQVVTEAVRREEAVDLAHDVFHRWVGKVRQSIPSPANP